MPAPTRPLVTPPAQPLSDGPIPLTAKRARRPRQAPDRAVTLARAFTEVARLTLQGRPAPSRPAPPADGDRKKAPNGLAPRAPPPLRPRPRRSTPAKRTKPSLRTPLMIIVGALIPHERLVRLPARLERTSRAPQEPRPRLRIRPRVAAPNISEAQAPTAPLSPAVPRACVQGFTRPPRV